MPVGSVYRMSRRTARAVFSALNEGRSRLGFFAANFPASFGPYKRHADIAYGTDPQQKLDVYAPEKSAGAPSPMVVFWHGGRWSCGDKADYRFVGAALAESGYLAVVANYRHYPQVNMPGFMEDAAQAALWADAHAAKYGADRERLYLMGHSAGAHMAVMLALNGTYFAAAGRPAPRVAGVIGLSGPYNFLPLREHDVQEMFGPPPRYPQSQPINFVRAGAPPMLLVHGLDDVTVWPGNSRDLATALSALAVPVSLKLYPKVSHGDTVAALTPLRRRRARTLADIKAFIDHAPTGAGAVIA
jgi:acetyl esterase/lipase